MENEIKDKPSISIPVIPKESELSTSQLRNEFNLKLKDVNYILLTIVVVLLVMVAALIATVAGVVIGAYQNQAASYQNLVNQITTQNNVKGK